MSKNNGKTILFNSDTDTVIVGSWNRNPNTGTAHGRMAKSLQADTNTILGLSSPDNIIGGSIKSDGSVAWRSETFNPSNPLVGNCDASNTPMAKRAEELIREGDTSTAKQWADQKWLWA
ncbi:hypothetical protein TrVE_jg1917 [Triparma verrucosa]|uniref:Uncharacterized protein n=2 Tax=Triparma TaxID=722752 RepID=A0A9W6ZHT2_9STRA|nr:hypothetical protein TrST_g6581 [Triparma strigata]GMI08328.1 hypothetical protein TrVE_jg1917 [Triparma verrucosa]